MTAADSLATILDRTRQNLLDLSLRNRLINTPRGLARSKRLDIVDELSDEVFRLLVRETKSMGFLPGRAEEASLSDSSADASDDVVHLSQPDDESNGGLAGRQRDNQLQTRLTSTNLQERLLGLYYDARTFEEEQGVSILYLALGFLEWYETDSSDKPRFAPLILVPVDLSRSSVSSRFKLKFREGDLETNLSLQAKLRTEFGVDLPDVGEVDSVVPSIYFASVEAAVQGRPRWKVHRDETALWFFSFAKYLMYRDLDPATWPAHSSLNENDLLRRLLTEGFADSPPLCDDQDALDALIPPERMIHVTDADSSQAVVIEEVRRGRNLVVQGPPGTGKSQTITNIIATAVHAGKKVLFVAEKMAALEVVKSRLDRVGLGATCLELHSHKANKKSTLEELNRTIELGRPRISEDAKRGPLLTAARERLNRHADLMNTPLQPSCVTPFQVIGQLVGCHGNGATSVPFELSNPSAWSKTDFEERRRRLVELENYIGELGDVAVHPWRGTRRTTPILPSEVQQFLQRVREQSTRIADLINAATSLCAELKVAVPADPSLRAIRQITELGRICIERPAMDRVAIANPIWHIHPAKIQNLVELGRTLATSKQIVDGVVAEVAWSTDLSETRQSLASYGRCWTWFLYPAYWKAIASLRGIVNGPPPRKLDEQLKLIDAMMTAQTKRREIRESGDVVGEPAFGSKWKGDNSDFEVLKKIVDWEQAGREAFYEQSFRRISSELAETRSALAAMVAVNDRLKFIDNEWKSILDVLQLEIASAFKTADFDDVPLAQVSARCAEWEANAESLSKWIGYQARRKAAEQDGLQSLVAAFEQGAFDKTQIVARFCQAYFESLLKDVIAKKPEFASFHGPSHDQEIQHFRELDVERMDVARKEVASSHFLKIPRESGLGEMSVIRGEIAKKRMHRPIRQLLRDAGRAVQAIKPVFMMSPISIAQFLEPGVLEFDLLVMDEASQVTPEDALGAMARAKQIVVVGDSRQLPPSRFFSKLLDDGEVDDDGDLINPSSLDSVLGLCVARGLPQRMLRWHYRSRHHSLIAVSNQEFYDNQLFVIPSPTNASEELGLQLRFLSDGRFDRGGTATNRREASVIADAVIEHARQRPDKSLGVAAFSVAQRDAIRNELELRLRKNPDLDGFFAAGRHESFFVKNLENVQGDERDVIFISVGYAPDESGNLTMNFGPLGTDGGERRLNVLITRAKTRCVVFSSITSDQIDLGRARSRGAAALKIFLQFAASGRLDAKSISSDETDSEFERQVSIALEQYGIQVQPQVGTTGFAIDLAIVDQEHPGRYLLGIECDGASYSSSRWARDRDRLREAALRDRGWLLHRVWSPDWLHRPDEQLSKLLAAIEQAQSATQLCDEVPEIKTAVNDECAGEIDRETQSTIEPSTERQFPPYVEAKFEVPFEIPINDVDAEKLCHIAVEVVAIETPVHRSEVSRRILSLWKQQRLGPAIARKIDAAIDDAVKLSLIVQEQGQFLSHPNQTDILVRSRAAVASAGLRKPEMIPPTEIRAAILPLVTQNVGISRDHLCSAITKALGLKVVSPRLRTIVDEELVAFLEQREIEVRDEKLYALARET